MEEATEKRDTVGDDGVEIRDLTTEPEKKLLFEKSFRVEYLDVATGETLSGVFTVKRPTLGDISEFGVIKSQLCGGLAQVDAGVAWINEMIAFTRVTLIKFPEWWDPTNIYDEDLLTKVYRHVRAFQDSFRDARVARLRERAAKNGRGSAGDRLAPKVVVPEVHPPA